MKTIRVLIPFMIICLNFNLNCYSQEIKYSHYNYLPVFYNPAVCGNHYESSVLYFSHSRQWPAFNNSTFKKSYFSYDFPIKNPLKRKDCCNKKFKNRYQENNNDVFGLGISFLNQECGSGDLTVNSCVATFAYTKIIGSDRFWSLSIGTNIIYNWVSIDFNKYHFLSQWNNSSLSFQNNLPPSLSAKSDHFSYPDFSIGLIFNYRNKLINKKHNAFQIGGSAIQLLKTTEEHFIKSGNYAFLINIHSFYRMVRDKNSFEPRLYCSFFYNNFNQNQAIVGFNYDRRFDTDEILPANENRDNQTKSLYLLSSFKVRLTPIRDFYASVGLRYKLFAFYFTYYFTLPNEKYYYFDGANGMQSEFRYFIK